MMNDGFKSHDGSILHLKTRFSDVNARSATFSSIFLSSSVFLLHHQSHQLESQKHQ